MGNDDLNIFINSSRLCVEVAEPGTLYKGSRFDWDGFVKEITFDKRHTFCVPESMEEGKGSGGHGMCGEFGIDEPIGYDEADVGECFPKIGIGLLKKPDNEKYNFFRNYQCVMPFKRTIKKEENSVSFCVEPLQCNGYAVYYEKKISVNENILRIDYFIENRGCKTISTSEYCHNFVGIDKDQIGNNYRLKLPYNIEYSDACGEIIFKDRDITWNGSKPVQEFYCRISGFKGIKDHEWDIYNFNKGVGIREKDNFDIYKVALWGSGHVISPETFVKIHIAPGENKKWTRKYEFFY